MKNVFIKTTLGSLLNVLDARTIVSIYGCRNNEERLLLNQCHVYEVLMYDGYEELKNCTVCGISVNLSITTILID